MIGVTAYHPILLKVAITAADGPSTRSHGFSEDCTKRIAVTIERNNVERGIHTFHRAVNHITIGALLQMYAGSILSPANIRSMGNDLPA